MSLILSFIADLTKALNQTKIVSYAHPQGPAQWKNTGQKLIQGTEELGALEVFLMNKVPISPQLIDRLADQQTDRYKQRERQKNTYTQRYFYRQMDRKRKAYRHS